MKKLSCETVINIFLLCTRDNSFFFINVFEGFQDYFARSEKKTKKMMMNSERSFLVGDVANMKRSIYSCITND